MRKCVVYTKRYFLIQVEIKLYPLFKQAIYNIAVKVWRVMLEDLHPILKDANVPGDLPHAKLRFYGCDFRFKCILSIIFEDSSVIPVTS